MLAGGSYGVFVLFGEEPLPQGIVYGNGHIEGREVRIAAEVAGRVIEHHLVEGSKVSAGDPVAVIDPADAKDRLRSAQAELATARQVRDGFDSQITTWRHHLKTAEKQRQRIRDLRSRNLASASDLDQAENAASEARAGSSLSSGRRRPPKNRWLQGQRRWRWLNRNWTKRRLPRRSPEPY